MHWGSMALILALGCGPAEAGCVTPDVSADATAPRLDLTPAEWHEDLAVFARELPACHADAFLSLPRERFDAEVAALDKRIADANGDEMLVGLQAIAKSIGDGHTGIVAPEDRRVLPLAIRKFGGEFRIVAAGPGLERALGARIVRIGGMRIARAWQRMLSLTPQGELDRLRREDTLVHLTRGYALHGLAITPSRDHAVFTLAPDEGEAFDLDVAALAPGADAAMISTMPASALAAQGRDAALWCKALERATVYCNWRAYQDLAQKARDMFALVDRTKADKLVIDMRDNGGGDDAVGYAEIVAPLKARAGLNREGHLFVLVGAGTVSAVIAAQLQDETAATLVGETIGEKPNSYREPRQFRLPNSHLVVRVSTLWSAFRKTGPDAVAPDREILPSWDDLKAGRDPVLDWALAQNG